MPIQHFTMGVDWPGIRRLMEVSAMSNYLHKLAFLFLIQHISFRFTIMLI